MKKILIISILFSISACDAEGNLGREESADWHKRTSTEDKVEYFKPKCEAYGFTEGSNEMSSCIQQEIQDSVAAARSRQVSMQTAIAEMNENKALQRQQITNTCKSLGGVIHCY